VFGIPGGHPDDTTPTPFDICHLPDGLGIEPARGKVGANTAIDFYILVDFADEISGIC
jgi:hypothetical protein